MMMLPDVLMAGFQSALISLLAVAPLAAQTVFEEQNGLLVIELESAAPLPDDWVVGPSGSPVSPNINAGEDATGTGYIVWEGSQFLGTPGNGEIQYFVQINNPGVYVFNWRNQVGRGTNTTDHNDTWLKIEADSFYGVQNNSIVCPIGYDPQSNDCTGDVPEGRGDEGWFKVYSSGANNWRFFAATSDNDAHRIRARFDRADVYLIRLSARSSSHVIDRMVLYREDYQGDAEDLQLPESPQFELDAVFFDGFE